MKSLSLEVLQKDISESPKKKENKIPSYMSAKSSGNFKRSKTPDTLDNKSAQLKSKEKRSTTPDMRRSVQSLTTIDKDLPRVANTHSKSVLNQHQINIAKTKHINSKMNTNDSWFHLIAKSAGTPGPGS